MPSFLPFFVVIAFATNAKIPAPSFDYWASDRGNLLLKADCRWVKYHHELTCKGTRVKVLPPDVSDPFRFVTSEMASLVKRPDVLEGEEFEEERREACDWTPAERFPYNGEYHKARNSFIGELGVHKAKMCESTTHAALKKAWKDFETFTKRVCELKYQKFEVKFTREKTGFRWTTSFQHASCNYLLQQALQYDPKGYKSPWTFVEQVDHKVGRRELAACEGADAPISATFSARFEVVKPSGCEFILDRERDWECCAFEK